MKNDRAFLTLIICQKFKNILYTFMPSSHRSKTFIKSLVFRLLLTFKSLQLTSEYDLWLCCKGMADICAKLRTVVKIIYYLISRGRHFKFLFKNFILKFIYFKNLTHILRSQEICAKHTKNGFHPLTRNFSSFFLISSHFSQEYSCQSQIIWID